MPNEYLVIGAIIAVGLVLCIISIWPRKRGEQIVHRGRPPVSFEPPKVSRPAEVQPPKPDPKGLRDRYYWYNEDALRLEHEVVETLNDGTNYTARRFGSAEKAEAFIKANLENPQPIGPPKGQFTKLKKV